MPEYGRVAYSRVKLCARKTLPLPCGRLFAMSGQGFEKGFDMADHSPAMPAELGAEMDYPAHEKSYRLFINLAKYGTLHVLAVLIAMACAFFANFGFFSALIVFIVISAVGIYILRSAPEHIA
jgi:hypothetical protein